MRTAIVLLFVTGCGSGDAFGTAPDQIDDGRADSSSRASSRDASAASSPDAAASSRDASAASSPEAAPAPDAAPEGDAGRLEPVDVFVLPVEASPPDSCEMNPPLDNQAPCNWNQLGLACDVGNNVWCDCRITLSGVPLWFCGFR